ncbi:polyphenol oxidase, chloroplastic-like [Actinidia eriantha]|uniref:polyphenol oxidase, chloroplastic-like n=1 Tax=Actinidia eriantha TaxID=165200 RepID=UPI0025833D4D|nr:polyphenol oxidase, chloroplastic-like [Actinidia eriantha]
MATLTPSTIPSTAGTPIASFSFLRKSHNISTLSRRNHSFKISCKSQDNESPPPPQQNHPRQPKVLDRRNVLIWLGGTTLAAGAASAAPVSAPDLTNCGAADLPTGVASTDCCPPESTKILEFKLPQFNSIRVRPAAHLTDDKYMAKFERAFKLMNELPDSDPRSFTQQADVHCAYCNGAYEQVGFPDLDLQVHNSWLFFPFHRYYLYFFEKILGKLIDDPNFAMPFWAWDTPKGMTTPARYANTNSPLYSEIRDAKHQPPVLMDLDYNLTDETVTEKEQISSNLAIMYRQVVSSGKTPKLFMGTPYRAGDEPDPGAGSLENTPHGPVHIWVGDRTLPSIQNMGNFATAGRDPLFYAHHGNVDRMWSIWKTLGGKRKDYTDSDWLNTEFLFYDEEARLVKVKVKDSLDEKKFGYEYQKIDVPWLKSRATPRVSKVARKAKKTGVAMAADISEFPITLDKIVRVLVSRPKKSRTQSQKDEEEEILVIDGIEVDREAFVKFDVFINDEDEKVIRPDNSEFAGSFVNVPRKSKTGSSKLKTCLRLGITELLEDLDAEGDESVVVTFVPRQGASNVTISGAKIEFES